MPASRAGHPAHARLPSAVLDALDKLRKNISSVYVGNASAIDRLLCCLLARGHCLIEDVPGVGKTVLATALAKSIDASFSRLQLTPDLLPSDILGVAIYQRDTGQFEFKPGPIFANIVLADEINRATPRTQTALLEAMNEASVTVDAQTHRLPPPFMLVATQNPSDFEGTYLLPENQLDRFLMRITLGYPAPADEARVLETRPALGPLHGLKPVMHADEVIALQEATDRVRLDKSLIQYLIAIAGATRTHEDLLLGLSPRGALALAQAARASALLAGRDYVIPEDITSNLVPVCAHRVIPRATLSAASQGGAATASILARIMQGVKSPA
jgi:MoxR-like ATPase